MKKLKERCAFTLVELIVVLVILAILAALLIPALTGYIDKAKKKQVIAETRMLHEAIQTEAAELYGTSEWAKFKSTPILAQKSASDVLGERYQAIIKLSEVPSLQDGGDGRFGAFVGDDGKVWVVTYYDGKGHVGLYIRETQEYIAYDTTEAKDYNSLLSDAVSYAPVMATHSSSDLQFNPYLRKDMILYTIGQTTQPPKS